MLNSLLRKNFFPQNILYCVYSRANNCRSSYLIRAAPDHRQSASDSRLQWGISRSRMTLQLWQDGLDHSIKDWKRGRQSELGRQCQGEVCVIAECVWWWEMGRRKSKYGAFLWTEARPAEWVEEKVTLPLSLVFFSLTSDFRPVWLTSISYTTCDGVFCTETTHTECRSDN